jgi:hypothetical protein
MCEIEPLDNQQARNVGVLAGGARHDDIVDVTVVEGAARRHDAIVTSKESHLRRIMNAAGVKLPIETV